MDDRGNVDDKDINGEEETEMEDDGDWDENEEITDGDESELEESEGEESSSDEEQQARPIKKARLKGMTRGSFSAQVG